MKIIFKKNFKILLDIKTINGFFNKKISKIIIFKKKFFKYNKSSLKNSKSSFS